MKHIVCYSGGHSSGLVAVEVARKFGPQNTILMNHDINANVEEQDIKRFKRELSDYLGIPITFASHANFDTKDQFDVCIEAQAFQVGKDHQALCTNRLKTAPFMEYLESNFPDKDCVIYYGFDAGETVRINRRSQILGIQGYKTDFPLAYWKDRTITSTHEINVKPPLTYGIWKHANCTGCLKAKKQHWFLVYVHRNDLFEKGKYAEDVIGHSIIKDNYLEDLEPIFERMVAVGITTTEHEDGRTFWARVRRILKVPITEESSLPCECLT